MKALILQLSPCPHQRIDAILYQYQLNEGGERLLYHEDRACVNIMIDSRYYRLFVVMIGADHVNDAPWHDSRDAGSPQDFQKQQTRGRQWERVYCNPT